MPPCTLIERLPTENEYNALRQAVGWPQFPPHVVQRALPRSLYAVCAQVEGEVVGTARVIGDDGLAYYIQDVMVLPAYQRQGIGTLLMDRVMSYLDEHAPLGAMVGLMSARGREPFYGHYGFIQRPNEQFGCGMIAYWPPQGRQSPRAPAGGATT